MAVLSSVPAGEKFERQLAAADPDMLRLMVKSFAEALMSAEADAACGAGNGEVSPERTNPRNGYRTCGWDTAHRLRTARRRRGPRPGPAGHQHPRGRVPQGRRPPGRGPCGPAGVHRVPP